MQFVSSTAVLAVSLLQLSLFPEFNSLSVMYGELSKDFIDQKLPYIRGEAPSTGAAGMPGRSGLLRD